jgi:hypothetical protein
MIACLAVVVALASCSGNGGGGGSKVKENEFFGKIPKIIADDHADYEAYEAKRKDLQAKGKVDELMKFAMQREAGKKERSEKYRADLTAECAKIAGRTIPFAISKALQSENDIYDVKAAKMGEKAEILVSVTAKKAISEKEMKNRNKWNYIYYRLVAKDGSTIQTSDLFDSFDIKDYAAGEILGGREMSISPYYDTRGAELANFASVEFITETEHEKYDNEVSEREKAKKDAKSKK